MARATLAPRPGMAAEVPPLRKRPLATMKDMGMDMSGMAPDGWRATMDHAAAMPGMRSMARQPATGHRTPMGHRMKMRDFSNAPQVKKGPGVQTIAPMPMDRTGEPGQGLEDVGHRVLVYKDLMALEPQSGRARAVAQHRHPPDRQHGTVHVVVRRREDVGQARADPVHRGRAGAGEPHQRHMMAHPIHLHGHFFELVTGHGDHAPRKHTVIVLPGGKVTWDFTADAVGDWAFHCHLLYHMHAGMMRVVSVRPKGEAA